MKVRTVQRARAIGKTGKAIVKSAAMDIRQMSCPRCHQTAIPARRPDGTEAWSCTACGTQFSCRRM